MFELDRYDPSLLSGPPAVPTAAYQPATDIARMSLLFWTEHCVECAAPACYQTCDLYQARADRRCRRFTFGARKNSSFPSLRGFGVEIEFKRWAKLEAYGNRVQIPIRSLRRLERLFAWAAPAGHFIGKLIHRLTGKERWLSATHIGLEMLVRRFRLDPAPQQEPDAFLVEVFNPGVEAVRLQFNLSTVAKAGNSESPGLVQLAPAHAATLVLPPGYSRHEVDAVLLRPVWNAHRPFLISMAPEADSRARLVFLTADFVTFAKRAAKLEAGQPVKCVVWDLDNTLWNGTLAEGDEVVLRPEVRPLLKLLDERGILQSIASKNEHTAAWQKLEEFGISEYFLHPQINWGPKSDSIASIAKQLNIGLDSLAFVDDSRFELEQVSRLVPEVSCFNAAEISVLSTHSQFQGSSSSEAQQRRLLYRDAIARESAARDWGASHKEFLATCDISLEIAPYVPADQERVAELVQRTNQLNFSGCKYTRAQLFEALADPRVEKLVLHCADKFGSYGTIGFSMVESAGGQLRVRDFMLSCRVQGKFLEQAFFHHLFQHHNADGATSLWVNFRQTARNSPALRVLESLGFRKCEPAADGVADGMVIKSAGSPYCPFIRVNCSAAHTRPAQAVLAGAHNGSQPDRVSP